MNLRRTRYALVAAAAALAMSACGNAGQEEASDTPSQEVVGDAQFEDGTRMAELAEQGSVKIGVKYDQPGIGFRAAGADAPTGFDVEMGKIVAGQLGIEPEDIEWVETVSDNREPFLQNGTVDFVLASYSITDERRQVVGQAGPYYVTGQQLLIAADDDSITGPEDLEGKRVCSVTGSTSIETVETEFGATPAGFDTYSECVDQLTSGSVDAVTTDGAILLGYASEDPEALQVVGDAFSEERYGIGYSLESPELCQFLSDTVTAASENGAYAEAFEATLGQAGVETPDAPEVDACA